jgi:hypothetical protein
MHINYFLEIKPSQLVPKYSCDLDWINHLKVANQWYNYCYKKDPNEFLNVMVNSIKNNKFHVDEEMIEKMVKDSRKCQTEENAKCLTLEQQSSFFNVPKDEIICELEKQYDTKQGDLENDYGIEQIQTFERLFRMHSGFKTQFEFDKLKLALKQLYPTLPNDAYKVWRDAKWHTLNLSSCILIDRLRNSKTTSEKYDKKKESSAYTNWNKIVKNSECTYRKTIESLMVQMGNANAKDIIDAAIKEATKRMEQRTANGEKRRLNKRKKMLAPITESAFFSQQAQETSNASDKSKSSSGGKRQCKNRSEVRFPVITEAPMHIQYKDVHGKDHPEYKEEASAATSSAPSSHQNTQTPKKYRQRHCFANMQDAFRYKWSSVSL